MTQPPPTPSDEARKERAIEALHHIVLEAHETIPRDGKDAIYASLMRVADIAVGALKADAIERLAHQKEPTT